MLKKSRSLFVIVAALLIGLLVVLLVLIDFGEMEPLGRLSDEDSTPAQVSEVGDVVAQETSAGKVSSNSQLNNVTSEPDIQQAEFPENSPEASEAERIEEALLERELTKAKIAAEYSTAGDGTLTEADLRRYAEERYLKRRDLNGNGRLDDFELRAIGRDSTVDHEESTDNSNNLREL